MLHPIHLFKKLHWPLYKPFICSEWVPYNHKASCLPPPCRVHTNIGQEHRIICTELLTSAWWLLYPISKGTPIDPTTEVIMQDTMSRIYEQLEGLYLLHALALEMFKNLQPTNISDQYHQGPPPHLAQGFANRSQHHYSQMIQKLTLRCQHHLIKIVQKFPIKCQHQIQIRNHQVREGTKWTQRAWWTHPGSILAWYSCVPPNQTKTENQKMKFPFKRCLGMPVQVYLKMKFLQITLIQIIAKST